MPNAIAIAAPLDAPPVRRGAWRFVRRNPTLVAGTIILAAMTLIALIAPWIAGDPVAMKPSDRLLPPSALHWLGTDHLGRDVWARTVFGARVSLFVGFAVAVVAAGDHKAGG